MRRIVLASSSRYRRELLEKLGLPFEFCAPDIDESPMPGEVPDALVQRLALQKALAVAKQYPDALIIGSDQVSVLEGHINGKPLTRERAIAQLLASSGKRVRFHTGLCLLEGSTGKHQVDVDHFDVVFRTLTREAIERYVDRESPLQCAGSFKSEGYGITLFSALKGRDPNTLIGLPLIRLVAMLSRAGIPLP